MPNTPHRAATSPRPRLLHDGRLWEYQGDVIDKLTDASLYTGIHKQRFRDGPPRVGGGAKHGGPPPDDGLDLDSARWAAGLRRDTHVHAPRPRAPGAAGHGPVRSAARDTPARLRGLRDDLERLLEIEARLGLTPTPTCWPGGSAREMEAEVQERWAYIQRVAPAGVPRRAPSTPPRHHVVLRFSG